MANRARPVPGRRGRTPRTSSASVPSEPQPQPAPGPSTSAWSSGRGPFESSSRFPQPPALPSTSGGPQPARHAITKDLNREMHMLKVTGATSKPPQSRPAGEALRKRDQTDLVSTRPSHISVKKGTSGRKVTLSANYFELVNKPDWSLYQYRVDFSPEEDRTVVKKRLLRAHSSALGCHYIFDGTVLFVVTRLHPEPLEIFTKNDAGDGTVRITIKNAGELVMGDHCYLQLFNIVLRKCLEGLKLQLVGRDYYDAEAKIVVEGHPIELWPGYLTSIRQHENSILMCAEISHKVMRLETGQQLLKNCQAIYGNQWQHAFQENIIGMVVLTGYNNRTYRIDDVDFQTTPLSEFEMGNEGKKISYMDYYKQKYNLKITNTVQPLLVSKSKPREIRAGMSRIVYLVPELCRLTGFSDEMRSNVKLMRALADETRLAPRARIEKLLEFNRRLHSSPAVRGDLECWQMSIASSLISFQGRILDPETILLNPDSKNPTIVVGESADWTRDMRNRCMFHSDRLERWAMIHINKFLNEAQNFYSVLHRAGGSLEYYMSPPLYYGIRDDKISSYVYAIEEIINKMSPQLIMIIVPNDRAERYNAIKKKCCVDRAYPTQVVLQKNFSNKGLMSIASKIIIQMNCKLGGTPWSIHIPLSGIMICGYDVCHDTSTKGRSFGAMVASLNRLSSRYFSAVSAHNNGEELSNDLSMNIVKAAVRYSECNDGALPSSILMYRDGVGEGQIPFVHKHEVELIKSKLAELYLPDKMPPKLSYVIVSKRINTRIFHNGQNPPPGTIVDDCITSPDRYDFFLVSQSVRQGTVSPTSYNVIEDTSCLTPERMQRLTYKMTHLYYNWSGTIRVPAQCQYAHKLAYLVGQTLHQSPHPGLDNLLFYL